MRLAVEKGYPYVLILDQDSVPQQGMVQALVETHRRHPERHRVAIVAPQAIDPGIRSRPRYIRKWKGPLFELVRTGALPLENVTLVIASGALLPSEAILALGPFREDYFIDYVDTEYCLRALAHGYRIVVAGNACLHHHLGQQKAAKLGPLVVYPTRHTASRWYYMGRNRIPTLATYGARFPHWVAFDLAHGAYGLLRMLLTEDERGPKLAAYVRGTWDGFRGRMGPMPAQSEGPPTEGDRERQANR
jgi:rhamnosyltransferase